MTTTPTRDPAGATAVAADPIPTSVVDVAVIGGGPAGMAAALAVVRAGRTVAMVDEGTAPGGQIWRQGPGSRPTEEARSWLERLARSEVIRLQGTTVVDLRREDDGSGFFLLGERDGRGAGLRAERVILATGARERLLPFPGWTLPGVFGAGGAQALLTAGMPVAGRRAVVAGSGPLLLPVAAALARAGARVAMVIEQATLGRVAAFSASLWSRPRLLLRAARYRAAFRSAPYATGSMVTAARGDGRVERVTVSRRGRPLDIPCDLLCVGYGLVPSTELARLAGCQTLGGAVVVNEWQESTVTGVYSAGESTGIGGVELALMEGEIAGLAAAGDATGASLLHRRRDGLRALAARMELAFAPGTDLRTLTAPGTIVCRCEDVTLGELNLYTSPRQAKIHSRAGMGPCQGRICGPALHFLKGWEQGTVRPPTSPALVSTLLAGSDPPPDSGE